MNEIFDDLKFLIDDLGLTDEQVGEVINTSENIGVRPEYFADEFIFVTGRGLEEDALLHDNDYLNIAVFNATYWEF